MSITALHQLDEGFLKKCKSQGGSPPPPGNAPPYMAGLCLADALVTAFINPERSEVRRLYAMIRSICLSVCRLKRVHKTRFP